MKYHRDGSKPENGEVFVFGSNMMGIHGAGAALQALLYGAEFGHSDGRCGNTYAIPTKVDLQRVVPRKRINASVLKFIDYANAHPELEFFVTRIGCGYAGYKDAEIAPMFGTAPENCSFADEWREYLEDIRV